MKKNTERKESLNEILSKIDLLLSINNRSMLDAEDS